jgi:hypothetical protein
MDKHKKNFIEKLQKKSKQEIITLVCSVMEENFHLQQALKHQKSVCFSHEIVLKSILSHVSPIAYDFDNDDEETKEKPVETESLRSYA